MVNNGAFGGWDKGFVSKGASLERTFTVAAGDRVRVALAWNSHTAGPDDFSLTDTLTADLDLRVLYPGGVVSSVSYDNASEFVSFTAPQAGTVTIQVSQARFDRSSESWGLAWLHE